MSAVQGIEFKLKIIKETKSVEETPRVESNNNLTLSCQSLK